MDKWTIGQLGNLGTSASIVVLLLFLLPEVPSWQRQRFILYIELAWPALGDFQEAREMAVPSISPVAGR